MAEGKNEVLTMAVAGGVFLVGTLIGGNKLLLPRVFTTFEEKEKDPATGLWKKDPETGDDALFPKIRMQPLPGVPPFVLLKGDGFTYPVPESDIFLYRLYRKVTTPPTMETGAKLN
jgi:hypothetical protein